MKACLYHTGERYHLKFSDGASRLLTKDEARRFLEFFDADFHCSACFKLGTLIESATEGIKVAWVDNTGRLIVESAPEFRLLLTTEETPFLTAQEFAAKHGKQSGIVMRLCREGRLPGAVKKGRDWIIPADTPYPRDARLGKRV